MSAKVLVGFSGGVDSTVAVIMLKEAGYDAAGLCFSVLGNNYPEKAVKAAEKLGIKLYTADVSEEFKKSVIEPFKTAYEHGYTPNPCILCNPAIKFKTLIEAADREGFDYIASGHYAGITEKNGIYYVRKAVNSRKDQSYMLYRLEQNVLSRLILPLSEYKDKDEIRKLAEKYGMPNAGDKDSQDICFIPDGDYAAYLLSLGAENKPGFFINEKGEKLSRHKGILHYTIGQRKGLGIALGRHAFVSCIDSDSGNIGLSLDEKAILHKQVTVNQLFFTGIDYSRAEKEYSGKNFKIKLRYSAKEADGRLYFCEKKVIIEFMGEQRAPTPGQSAVFYDGSVVIGGGYIEAYG